MPPPTKPRLSFDEIEGRVLAGASGSVGTISATWREFAGAHLNLSASFAYHHERLWEWCERVEKDKPQRPIVCCWGRGAAKSTTIQGGLARIKEKKTRNFGLYVSGTQDQADAHLSDLSVAFEEMGIERALSKYGHSKGWNSQMLRCADGFSLVSIGLDKAMAGLKLEGFRPDFIVLDDLDEQQDSEATVKKKVLAITKKILPAMAPWGIVAYVQNIPNPEGIMPTFIDGTNEFLLGAEVVGPIPACYGLTTERSGESVGGAPMYKVTGGMPTWEGQSLEVIEHQINTWGLPAFLMESQHEFDAIEGALWTKIEIEGDPSDPESRGCQLFADEMPEFEEIAIGYDPAATSKKNSDLQGIIVAARGKDKRGYVLLDRSDVMRPGEACDLIYRLWGWFNSILKRQDPNKHHVIPIIVETNQGGEFVMEMLQSLDPNWTITGIHAHENKTIRAQPVSVLYHDGRVSHVIEKDAHGVITNGLAKLERQMTTWDASMPGKSPDRIDAMVMVLSHLLKESMYATSTTRRYRK